MIRPVTLWPFPSNHLSKIEEECKKILVIEMSNGQMVEDVKLSVKDKSKVFFYGFGGGWCPTPNNLLQKIREVSNYE